jgi:hypothetical protein
MTYQYRRIKYALGVTLAAAVCAASPAAARFELNPPQANGPQTTASTGVCSEVCSGGGYTPQITATSALAEPGARLPHNPRDRPAVPTGAQGAGHPAAPTVHVVAHDSGFHWGDAAIGAGAAIVLLLVTGLGARATATRRSRRLAQSGAGAAG